MGKISGFCFRSRDKGREGSGKPGGGIQLGDKELGEGTQPTTSSFPQGPHGASRGGGRWPEVIRERRYNLVLWKLLNGQEDNKPPREVFSTFLENTHDQITW